MSLSLNFTYPTLPEGMIITYDVLNALFAGVTIDLEGSIGTLTLADDSVTLPKIQDAIFTADSAGRAPFVSGWLNLALVATDIGLTAAYFGDSAQKGLHHYAAGTLSAGVYSVTLSPAPTTYTAGMVVRFKADSANGTGGVDVNVNTIGAANIYKNVNQELAPGDIAANQIVELIYDGSNFQLQLKNHAAVVATSRNLLAFNNAGTPNSKVDVTADEVVLKDSNSAARVASSVSVTVDMTASGANGLDTGSEASGTWYYVWLIYNGTTVAGLFSTSATAPTLPSGYTFKALIGQCYNNGSSNLDVFRIHDRQAWTVGADAMSSHAGSLTYTTLSLAAFVPPNAKAVSGTLSSSATALFYVAATSGGLGEAGIVVNTAGAAPYQIPLVTAQTLYYKSGGTGSNYSISVSGYRF